MKKLITLLLFVIISISVHAKETVVLDLPLTHVTMYWEGKEYKYDTGKLVVKQETVPNYPANINHRSLTIQIWVPMMRDGVKKMELIDNRTYIQRDTRKSFTPDQYVEALAWARDHYVIYNKDKSDQYSFMFCKNGARPHYSTPVSILIGCGQNGDATTTAHIKYSEATWKELITKIYNHF